MISDDNGNTLIYIHSRYLNDMINTPIHTIRLSHGIHQFIHYIQSQYILTCNRLSTDAIPIFLILITAIPLSTAIENRKKDCLRNEDTVNIVCLFSQIS